MIFVQPQVLLYGWTNNLQYPVFSASITYDLLIQDFLLIETLESIATIFALIGGILSVIFAVWGVYREWDLSRKEKAEELLNTLVEELGEQFTDIEDSHGWNIINDYRNFNDIIVDMDAQQVLTLQRTVRKLLRRMESISIRTVSYTHLTLPTILLV